jgi:TetR/AcrR family transcriptional regulator
MHAPSSPPPAAHPESPAAIQRPSAARRRKEDAIVTEAERQFAQFGFEGATLEGIAAACGISRHNLLYYFPSKEALYQRVLDAVLDQWLAGMQDLAQSDAPQQALRQYIRAKLRYSRERPHGVKVFAKEIIAGAPRYAPAITERVAPLLQAEVQRFERWADEGRIARVDFTHLMFALWALTQSYAEQEAQFALLLGRPALTEADYTAAETLICRLVFGALGLAE